MNTAKHHYSPLVPLIKIFRFPIWLVSQKYWLKSIGKWTRKPSNQQLDSVPNSMYFTHTLFSFVIFREKLCGHLPARAEGYSWSLAFSTSQHGFSLNSLYRKLHRLESPILIVIQDTDNNVSWIGFRAFLFLVCLYGW